MIFWVGGSISFIIYVIVVWGFTKAPIPLVAALRETSIFFSIFIGYFFLKETINLKKIDENSSEGNAVIILGKVLGTGKISHKISLSSFSISNSAASKIKESGGEVLKFSEMIEKYPTGTGVKIIG